MQEKERNKDFFYIKILKRYTFRIKLSDSIFLLGLSPIVNYFDMKSKSF